MFCWSFYILGFLLIFFFFFQAEDGIRDHCVTGVQTCALPILASAKAGAKRGADLANARALRRPEGGGYSYAAALPVSSRRYRMTRRSRSLTESSSRMRWRRRGSVTNVEATRSASISGSLKSERYGSILGGS